VKQQNLLTKFKFGYNLSRVTGNLQEVQRTFMTTSRSLVLRMTNVSDKDCKENQTNILYSVLFFLNSCHSLDNVEK